MSIRLASAVIALSLAAYTAHAFAEPCARSDFTVTNLQWKNMRDVQSIAVTGDLFNNCMSPAYATVQLILYDESGKIVDSTPELWLAGMTNIPPKSPREFYYQMHFIGDAYKIEAKIVHVKYSH